MTETITSATRPLVPQLRREVVGESFAGPYWNQTTYGLVLDVTGDRFDAQVQVSLVTTSGHVVYSLVLDRAQAFEVGFVCKQPRRRSPVREVPGLGEEMVWDLGDDMEDHVTLRNGVLEEVSAWLGCAVGSQLWDYDADGDEWEY